MIRDGAGVARRVSGVGEENFARVSFVGSRVSEKNLSNSATKQPRNPLRLPTPETRHPQPTLTPPPPFATLIDSHGPLQLRHQRDHREDRLLRSRPLR